MAKTNQSGFTLIELMIVTSILVILIAVGVPGLQAFIKNNRMVANTNLMMVSIKTARSEAMTQRTPVTLCRSSDGAACGGTWSDGHIAFLDADADGTVDGGETILLYNRVDNPDIVVTYSGGNFMTFDRRGRAVGTSGAMLFCDDRGSEYARGITVDPIGRSRTTGGALVCPE
jgi:type IV fimbrial biogenesis protein FimT